jgi:hypothetical protein
VVPVERLRRRGSTRSRRFTGRLRSRR